MVVSNYIQPLYPNNFKYLTCILTGYDKSQQSYLQHLQVALVCTDGEDCFTILWKKMKKPIKNISALMTN